MRYDTRTPGPSSAPLMQALADLAQLSLEAGDPGRDVQSQADALLTRVRQSCGAPLGALLLSGGVTAADTTRVVSLPGRPDSRFFALATFGVADPRMLASKPAALEPHMDTATLVAGDIWVTQPVPLASGSLSVSLGGRSPVRVAPVTQALMLLGWPVVATPSDALVAARERLRFLADGIGATLSHLLLRRQVNEGEMGNGRASSSAPLAAPARERAPGEGDRLKDELLRSLSRELRSPLAAIKDYTALLLRRDGRLSTGDRHELLTAIETESERLSVTVERVLELSQLEAGTAGMRQDPVAIATVTRDAVASAEGSAYRHTPAVTFRLRSHFPAVTPERPGPLVYGDARRLRMVLDHLLENAARFSPAGGDIEITLQTAGPTRRHAFGPKGKRIESGGPRLQITVRDHGVGIPTDQLDRIFESFYRVDTTPLSNEVEGQAIGLALCKRIVELHGGALWAESEEGKGSSFHLTLPLMS